MTTKLIWDLPTRLFHWAIAALICGSYYTVEISGDMDTHMLIGQIILTLVLFRVVWGFVGTRYARFGSFLAGPGEIFEYAKSLAGTHSREYAGHNPLGGVVVLIMLALLLAQTVSGLFSTDGDFYAGPLNDLISARAGNQVTEFHEINFAILVIVVTVHIAAAFFYLLVKRSNLIAPMITGQKRDLSDSFEAIQSSRALAAIIVLAAVAATVLAVVTFA
jgi:cytochrome b